MPFKKAKLSVYLSDNNGIVVGALENRQERFFGTNNLIEYIFMNQEAAINPTDIPASARYDDTLKAILSFAGKIARDNLHAFIYPAHIIKAALHRQFAVGEYLQKRAIDIYYLEDWADTRIDDCTKTPRPDKEVILHETAEAALEEADTLRTGIGLNQVTAVVLLAAMAIPGLAFTYDQLKTFPYSKDQLLQYAAHNKKVNSITSIQTAAAITAEAGMDTLQVSNPYCTDLNILYAFEESPIEITGRENEIRFAFEILNRKNKANLLIVGDAGVGKTSFIKGLVKKVVQGHVAAGFSEARFLELNLTALTAGTSHKSEAEDRLKNVFIYTEQFECPVLIIEDIHILFDKNRGYHGLADMLKLTLMSGEMMMIATTVTENFRKTLEPEVNFVRYFEQVQLDEPKTAVAQKMIEANLPALLKHYECSLQQNLPGTALRLAQRFLKEKKLPDAAIDLLDRTLSSVTVSVQTIPYKLKLIEDFRQSKNGDALAFLETFYQALGPVLLGRLEQKKRLEPGTSKNETDKWLNFAKAELEYIQKQPIQITEADLVFVVADKTGIPAGKLQASEKERLLKMEESLRARVIGQDHAIKNIADAVMESRSGLQKGQQPIGSFFFLGPTGTGKTELVKALSNFLFSDDKAMIRFDMSEFKEEHSAALLYGAPPGYVGYEEGGMLVNKIREKPYSVVLFDEIEKAHPSVFDTFLQIMDEGVLHDRLGKSGDFSNAIVIFTSNIGSKFIVEEFSKGNIPASASLLETMSSHFRPEFLGRLTEIIPFAPISESMISRIFNIHLAELKEMLLQKNIRLDVTDDAAITLAKMGHSPQYGARPLKGIIRDKIRRPLSRLIIAEKIKPGNTVLISTGTEGQPVFDIRETAS